MATKKAASKKNVTATTAAPSKKPTTTKITTIRADAKPGSSVGGKKGASFASNLPSNIVSIVFVELFGTFALTLVAIMALSSLAPLYLGLALVALFIAIGAISGAHLNPAITFGFWVSRRLSIVTAAFYWVAQFLGAMAAVVLVNLLSDGMFAVDFTNFTALHWSILIAELVGTAVFMYGFMSATARTDTAPAVKALGVGLSFMLGLLVATSLITAAQSGIDQMKITSVDQIPHELRIKDATLNPAVAVAETENTDTQLQGGAAQKDEKQVSRFSLEVILGTFIGAAIGALLYQLTNYRSRR